jgi:putative transposase
VPCAAGQGFVGTPCQAGSVRTAYRCRAYPDAMQQAMLNRTFGCVRVVWNTILAARRERYATERAGTSYGQASAELTAMKHDPQRAWLNEVSCVPLQQALRHQQQAFAAFFAQTARYPRFKSRAGRQAAEYTRSAFTLRGGQLRLAKTPGPLAFAWSWPDVDVAGLDPTTVFVSKEPDGQRWLPFLAWLSWAGSASRNASTTGAIRSASAASSRWPPW